MAGEFLATHNSCSWCNRATYWRRSIVAPFDAMLLALIEDCIRSDAARIYARRSRTPWSKEVFNFVTSRWPKILEKRKSAFSMLN
jgi:hypothetical protein